MNLSRRAISEFQETYHKVYDSEIAVDVAERMGLDLLGVFRLVYRQVPVVEKKTLAMYRKRVSVYK